MGRAGAAANGTPQNVQGITSYQQRVYSKDKSNTIVQIEHLCHVKHLCFSYSNKDMELLPLSQQLYSAHTDSTAEILNFVQNTVCLSDHLALQISGALLVSDSIDFSNPVLPPSPFRTFLIRTLKRRDGEEIPEDAKIQGLSLMRMSMEFVSDL
ncbi:Neuronal PAS domain-containing protein 3 [Fukomys damarensis]|uniref:Neuronal PAS domain-containing protein 3 n=1 Tax=Fukomys damarensis TaxID=885580 RepID=A0A091DGA1_FUKDA|nr:Neuronal PAS domain-containing protein 3 [Fukomys damarensis]